MHADVAMVTYNPTYTDELPVIEAAAKLKKGILIKKGLASGYLQKIADVDPVQKTLDFILGHSGVSSVVVGTTSAEHLKHNVECALQTTLATP